jgi:hypothetical protein
MNNYWEKEKRKAREKKYKESIEDIIIQKKFQQNTSDTTNSFSDNREKQKRKKLGLVLSFLFILTLVFVNSISAENLLFKQNDNVNYRFRCLDENNSYCNSGTILTISIEYPNGTNAKDNLSMTYNPTYFNVTLPTDVLGEYNSIIVSPTTNGTVSEFKYEVTANGKENASGMVIILFILIFLILVASTCFLTLYSLGHLIRQDFDIIDLSIDWGMFFVLLAVYYLEIYYLGNLAIETYLLWFIALCSITLVIIPSIAFLLSLFHGVLGKQKFEMNNPKRIKFMRSR